MMSGSRQERLAIGTRIAIHNQAFEIAYVDHMTVRYTPCEGGRVRRIPVETFWSLFDEGVIGICGEAELESENYPAHLWQLTDQQRGEMQRRYEYIASAMQCGRHVTALANLRTTIDIVAKRKNDPNPPSRATLARWLQTFAQSDGNLKSLVPRHHKKGRRNMRFSFEMESIVQETIKTDYLTGSRISIEQVICNIIGQAKTHPWLHGQSLPSRASIYRRVAALDPYVVALKRYGATVADRRFRAAGASLEVVRPMQMVMIDGHRMDVLVVDAESGEILGRPFLVCLFDVASRAVVGWHISLVPFCATTALAAIKDMCARNPASEPGGIPEVVIPDNGPDLASNALRKLCMWLGIHIEPAKAYSPNDKAHIERFFGTVNMMLVHLFPGTTFSSPSDRGEYASEKLACLTLSDVKKKFGEWLTSIYHVHTHSITQRAPIMLWRELQGNFPILHFSAAELDVVARVAHRRSINKGRVLVNHLYYKSDGLAMLEARKMGEVNVLIDEMDLGFVYVQHDSDLNVLYRADAVRREYTKELTQYEHDKVLAGIKKLQKDDLKTLGEHAYELARWELWKDNQQLVNTRSGRRLKALRNQKDSKKGEHEEPKVKSLSDTAIPSANEMVVSAPVAARIDIPIVCPNQPFTL